MTRILSLVCGLALAGSAAAQDRAPQPRQPQPERPKADAPRDLQAELERLRAQVRELEARLNRDGDRRPETKKDVAPMPRAKDGERGPAPKADGPMGGGRGSFGPPAGGFGPGGFPPFGGVGPKGPQFGGGSFGPPAAQGRGPAPAGPGDVEQRLNRIIDELERLRDDLHRGSRR